MVFLKTNHITILGKSRFVDVILFPGKCGEAGDPISPLAFQITHRRPSQGHVDLCSCSIGLAALVVV